MAFRGLFVGTDRYASPDIGWLSCARRDARALHALFTDNLGAGAELLIDEQATRQAIHDEFERLFACDTDDVVVLAFSGHGTDTHELVTHDANFNNLAGTCIPLELLGQWFDRIPARRILCFLDCCFSGGLGAKVLHAPAATRSLASAGNLLDRLSGEGRVILTASRANEPAWEHRVRGHGFMTYYLLEALQGAEDIRDGGRVGIYRLLEYVSRRVTDAAAQIGQPQHPTLRGQIDQEVSWPVFRPGPAFSAAFPERTAAPVTADVHSLAAHGFPDHVLDAWAGAIPSLNQLQLDAVNQFGLLEGKHVVVSAPTSSGKTMVGELAALKGALERKRAVFLLPLKALVNDKHRHFTSVYGPAGLRVIRATGDYSADTADLLRGRYDICLMTYEKFANLLLAFPHLLRQIGTVVIDEVQMIADPNRGTTVEFLLTLLRMRRRYGIEPQIVALSAVIGDTNGLERWLDAGLLCRTERPVPLDEGVLLADGSYRYVDPAGQEQRRTAFIRPLFTDGKHRDWVIPLVRRLVGEGKQVIVFRETKGEARHCARYLADALGLPAAREAIAALPAGDPSNASQDLRSVLEGGVAFHVADLTPDERSVVESQFRAPNANLRVIASTTTLAMGVNTPASAVVIVGLEHPGPVPYTVAEYKNIVGRAGRLGHAEQGESYLLAVSPHEEHQLWTRYVRGVPEDLRSHFFSPGSDPRSLLLRVLAAANFAGAEGMTAEELVEFIEGSFAAYQEQRSAPNWRYDRDRLFAALGELASHGLIEPGQRGGYHLTELGRVGGESGLAVESLIRLVDALRPCRPEQINTATLVTTAQLTVELDDVYFPVNKRSTIQEAHNWAAELRNQNTAGSVMHMLSRGINERHEEWVRAKKAVACLLWMTDRPLLDIERVLMQHGGAFGGVAGPIQSVAGRTFDVLPTVARVAEILHPGVSLGEKSRQVLVRLENGIPSALVEIAAQTSTRLSRPDYLRLLQAGITTIAHVAAATDTVLLTCVGGDTTKLENLRQAVEDHGRSLSPLPTGPILPPPED